MGTGKIQCNKGETFPEGVTNGIIICWLKRLLSDLNSNLLV
jgi:hypothetical protein